jgi:hypothetical protein
LAAKAPADGYTLLLMSNAHTVNETLIANKPYSLTRDFTGVAPINYSDLLLVAHPSTGFQNIADLIKFAKEHPGKLNFASSGPGTPYHMAGELFKSLAHIDLVHVPYKGSSGARTDVIGGQVDMMFDAVTTMTEQVPWVRRQRFAIEKLGPDFWRVVARYGFMERPNIPILLKQVKKDLPELNIKQVNYYVGHETIVSNGKNDVGLTIWQEIIYAFMQRNSANISEYFRLPCDSVIEIGRRIEI